VGKEDGQWLIDRVRSFGVATESVRQSELPTGITVAASLKEDRAFLTFNGANNDLDGWLVSADLRERMSKAKHVHFACPMAAAIGGKIVRELQQAGTTVSVDSGWQEGWLRDAATWELLREVDLFLPNEAEARLLTGQTEVESMMKAFAEGGLKRVAIKLGAKGAALWNGKEILRGAAPAVEVVDTTGAGDAFDAGFLHAFLAGAPDEICLERGAICGSLSTRKAGALEAFPELEEVLKYHGNSAKR
jgi:sugar/nucleoside kinase (ribokinase family)